MGEWRYIRRVKGKCMNMLLLMVAEIRSRVLGMNKVFKIW